METSTSENYDRRYSISHLSAPISRKYPNANYVGVYKMSTPSLLVRNLDLVHNILSRNFASFEENDFSVNKELDPLVSENPFVKTGDEWKQGRSIISPMLTISKVKAMFPALKNTCEKLSLYLSTCVEQEFEAKEVSGTRNVFLERQDR